MSIATKGTVFLDVNEYKDFFNEMYNPDENYIAWRDNKLKEINESVSIHTEGENWGADFKDFDLSFVDDIAKSIEDRSINVIQVDDVFLHQENAANIVYELYKSIVTKIDMIPNVMIKNRGQNISSSIYKKSSSNENLNVDIKYAA